MAPPQDHAPSTRGFASDDPERQPAGPRGRDENPAGADDEADDRERSGQGGAAPARRDPGAQGAGPATDLDRQSGGRGGDDER